MVVLRPSLRALGSSEPGKQRSLTLSLFKYTFLTRAWPTWARYAATIAIVAATLAVRLALHAWFPGSPFLLFFLAIILCSALFDHGAGMFSVLLSAALAKWFLIDPTGTLNVLRSEDIVGLSVFIAIGLISASVLEALHRVAHDLADANEMLVASEGEKDLLLQEASHRFKNELTMLSTMLRLQQRAMQDGAASSALGVTADRVLVLGRLHERLQRSKTTAVVDTRAFISALCDDLKTAIELRPIMLEVDAESHVINQERAVPVGLIINELLTNALKYAFPDQRPGRVKVEFVLEAQAYRLSVSDNGVGIAAADGSAGSGLGQRLVRAMASQLGGSLEIGPGPDSSGTCATVRFPPDGAERGNTAGRVASYGSTPSPNPPAPGGSTQ
jgi:two-component system, sensor histidine kinase PdtaS